MGEQYQKVSPHLENLLQVEPIVKHVPDASKQFLSVRPPPPAFHEAPPTPQLPSHSKEAAAASHEADGGARPLPCGSAFSCEKCKVCMEQKWSKKWEERVLDGK